MEVEIGHIRHEKRSRAPTSATEPHEAKSRRRSIAPGRVDPASLRPTLDQQVTKQSTARIAHHAAATH